MALGEVVVSATGIEKYFGTDHVLRGVDLEVRQHETVMLIGRSGSGKTTFLRCLNFLEEPTIGSVRIGDITVSADPLHTRDRFHREHIRQLRIRAGMVFQDFNLFPHMTALENCIEAPMRVKGLPRDLAIATAERLPRQGPPAPQAGRVPVAPVGGREAAGRHRPRADHGAAGAAVRRADQRPRPGAGGRGPRR